MASVDERVRAVLEAVANGAETYDDLDGIGCAFCEREGRDNHSLDCPTTIARELLAEAVAELAKRTGDTTGPFERVALFELNFPLKPKWIREAKR